MAEKLTPKQKAKIVAKSLAEGKTQQEACLDAGYSLAVAKHKSGTVCKRKAVTKELLERYGKHSNKDVGILGIARLVEGVTDGYKRMEPRVRPQFIRMCLEVGGQIGQNALATNLRNDGNVPALAADMIARRIMEIQQERENRQAIPVEVVSTSQPADRHPLPSE